MATRSVLRRLIAAGLALWIALAVVAPAPAQEATTVWPTDGWAVSTPEEQGIDSRLLAAMLAVVEAEDIALDSVLITRNGYLVTEVYFPPYDAVMPHLLFSVTKSVTSTLVGIALDRGAISGTDQSVFDFFPDREFDNFSPEKQAMTLDDLLTMRSGLDWPDPNNTLSMRMAAQSDWVQFVLDRPMAAQPGTEFLYNNGVSHTLMAIVQEATGTNAGDLAAEALLGPLGIDAYRWETDRRLIINGAWGLLMLPRDMAKFGYLFLHNGQWEDQQIVSEEWVAAATQAHVTFPEGHGYGYQWWIYPEHGYYAAQGLAGQSIFVVPDRAMVVVFTANLFGEGADWPHVLLREFILPAAESDEPLPPNPDGAEALEELIEAIAG